MRVRWGTPPVVVLGLAAIYLLAGKLGLLLAFVHASASAVWPPTGIALAATLLLGYRDRKSTRLNSSHLVISYAVFCLKKKKHARTTMALGEDLPHEAHHRARERVRQHGLDPA